MNIPKMTDLRHIDTRSALSDEERYAVRRGRQRAALHLVPMPIGKCWVPANVARSFSRGL